MDVRGGSRAQRIITEEEHEALNLLVMGLSREAIARRLSRSVRHVHRVMASIRSKLGVRNDLQMAIVAHRLGLLRPNADTLDAMAPAEPTRVRGRRPGAGPVGRGAWR